ncbi:MAG: hypothetical protein RBR02_10975 [Desulfuromonadaceae bacterium]|nr:hypothetical protein [Desulfuromonadaceae bacterium]
MEIKDEKAYHDTLEKLLPIVLAEKPQDDIYKFILAREELKQLDEDEEIKQACAFQLHLHISMRKDVEILDCFNEHNIRVARFKKDVA